MDGAAIPNNFGYGISHSVDGVDIQNVHFNAAPAAHGQVPLAHIDFIPECTDFGGVFADKKFERFDVLIQRANAWLAVRPQVRVQTCESIEVKKRSGDQGQVDTEKVTYYEYGEYRNKYIRALRIWIVSRSEEDARREPQQIGHVNIVPVCTDPGGVFSSPKFEGFGDTLNRLNQTLHGRPIPGRILNLETQDMKFHTWNEGVDPDETYWTESGKYGAHFLNVIRLFYEVTAPAYEEIGCADFVPAMLESGGFLSAAKFQQFGAVVAQARGWLSQQIGIRVLNAQSIDYKLKSSWNGDSLDTHRTMFYERGEGYTHYIRILRVCYVRPYNVLTGDLPPEYDSLTPPLLSYKSFSPVQLTKDAAFSTPKFESMTDTIRRATAWLLATGATVLAAETVAVRMYSGNQHGDPEQTYTWNHGDRNERWLYVVRVFLDGDYREPPVEALPPIPPLQGGGDCNCCCIS